MFRSSADVSAASVQSHDLVGVDNVTLRQQALVAERDVRTPAFTSAAPWRICLLLSSAAIDHAVVVPELVP